MKKLIISITILLSSVVTVYALTSNFFIDSSKLSFYNDNKNSITSNFKNEYNLSYSIKEENEKENKEITSLVKKTTFLLLGGFNNINESNEDYYKRHKDYLNLRYDPVIPKDPSTFSGFDENSQEYKDDLVSGFAVPSLFKTFNEYEIIYNSFGDIRVASSNDIVLASVLLKNVKMKEQNKSNPMLYDTVKTNLIIYYYYKKLDGEYKLYYLHGETTDDLSDYLQTLENQENKQTMQMASTYDSSLKEIYDFSKLEALSEDKLNNIYNNNINNIVILNSYYNNYSIASATGFFINKGLIVTTWNFLQKSLKDAQYIAIKDGTGKSYTLDGIVTANPETDIAVLKLKEKNSSNITLGNIKGTKTEDPVITISSKTGVGLTLQKGILISNNSYIQSSIPLTVQEEGSPLFDKDGKVIGINTAKQVNTSISIAIDSNALKEIQNKFNNIDFSSIKTIPFTKLKEEFYYVKYNEEIINNDISQSKWKKYQKIGNISETIKLKLVKASYKKGTMSLRYKNEISKYISSMQLATSFKEELIKEGYKEKLTGSKKCIYENNKYQIIIMDEFDYLIVVMVRK